MPLTTASFMRERKEFASAGPQLVTSTIAEARLRVSEAEYGDGYDHALSLKTAELLWDSPFGVSMRLDGGKNAENPYRAELKALSRERVPRIAVF